MPVALNQQTFRAPTGLALRRPGTNELLVTPAPSNIAINPGITEIVTTSRNPLGEQVNASSYIDANQPVITVTLPGYTLETLGIRLGKKFTAQNFSSTYEQLVTVTAGNKTKAAAASGVVGNGMLADQTGSLGFVLGDGGLSTALTRIADATIDQATDTQSFSQGADGAYKLTDDLIGSTVLLQFPLSITSQPRLSETIDQFFDINITVININGTMFKIKMPSAQTDLTNSGDLNFGEASIAFRAIYDGSSCQPIIVESLGQVVAC